MTTYTNTYEWPMPAEDAAYAEYLDNLVDELPGGQSYGVLLYKGDPVGFAMGKQEWLDEQEED